MPYNGSGVFAVYTPGTPYVTGSTISSTVANSVNTDFATGLTTAIAKDGQTTTTQAIPFAQGLTSAGTVIVTSNSANALAVGLTGSTNPALQVDASTASSATGIKVKSAAAAAGVALSVVSSGTDEKITIDAKGAGAIDIGSTSTGANKITLTGGTVLGGIPQNSKSAAYTTVLADGGRHILHPTADNNPRTFTIDSNANVAYPIGTAITFVNQINTLTIAITSDTLTLAGSGSTGSRTLAANGIATALKVASTSWVISGTALS